MLQLILSIALFIQITAPIPEVIGVEAPIIPEQYILMPGDGLLVNITGKTNYSYSTVITYEGKLTINLPVGSIVSDKGVSIPRYDVVDAVVISGLTMHSAQDTLTKTFGLYLKDVSVKLTLTALRKGIVFVTGEVQNPGVYNAFPVERVSQIIEKAGGVTPIGSKSNIKLIRNNTERTDINIEQFEMFGNLESNPRLESGDIIYVPQVKGIVTVKGALFGRGESKLRTSALTTEKERISEGVYELNPQNKISDMIAKAGGVTPWADLSFSYIERLESEKGSRLKIPIDLYRILFEKDTTADLLMRSGDILVVPPMNTLVYVQGEVTNPGAFLFSANLRSSDYIGQAGGPTNYANNRGVYIRRLGKKISAKTNPLVEPGDIIVVPRTTFKWWQDYATIISAIAIPIATALLYLRVTE
ncbi:MAG: SLBB domain-containing protein [Candidatus Latescibacteria bacterium]|nr:SLBB domain-containing protein [Candidatus Latescibacterota bacterium]